MQHECKITVLERWIGIWNKMRNKSAERGMRTMKEDCLTCKAPPVYLEADEEMRYPYSKIRSAKRKCV